MWYILGFGCRLNAGALYILWLQIGQGPGGVQIHRAVHSAMQGLLATGVNLRVNGMNAVIMSVSTAGTVGLEHWVHMALKRY